MKNDHFLALVVKYLYLTFNQIMTLIQKVIFEMLIISYFIVWMDISNGFGFRGPSRLFFQVDCIFLALVVKYLYLTFYQIMILLQKVIFEVLIISCFIVWINISNGLGFKGPSRLFFQVDCIFLALLVKYLCLTFDQIMILIQKVIFEVLIISCFIVLVDISNRLGFRGPSRLFFQVDSCRWVLVSLSY